MANSPASLGVAIDLAHTRVHPDANRCNECRLSEVGTETRPEVVIEVRPPVERTGVKRQPVSYATEERDEQRKSDDAEHEAQAKANLPRRASTTVVRVGHRHVAISTLRHRDIRGTTRLRSRRRVGHGESKSTGSPNAGMRTIPAGRSALWNLTSELRHSAAVNRVTFPRREYIMDVRWLVVVVVMVLSLICEACGGGSRLASTSSGRGISTGPPSHHLRGRRFLEGLAPALFRFPSQFLPLAAPFLVSLRHRSGVPSNLSSSVSRAEPDPQARTFLVGAGAPAKAAGPGGRAHPFCRGTSRGLGSLDPVRVALEMELGPGNIVKNDLRYRRQLIDR